MQLWLRERAERWMDLVLDAKTGNFCFTKENEKTRNRMMERKEEEERG